MQTNFDVVIIGGSSAGLAAGMSLARALRKVLIIDSGQPCNRTTPYSHNFITQDGVPPAQIIAAAKSQVMAYPTVQFINGTVTEATGNNNNFSIALADGKRYTAKKLLFATGIKDIMPDIPGFAECWGISVIHCPYCHGYEYRGQSTGILLNGEHAADFAKFIQNWTTNLTLFTNGPATFTADQYQNTITRGIPIVEERVHSLKHENGHLKSIQFTNGYSQPLQALYARLPFEQHCKIPQKLGCELTEQGYVKTDEMKKTTVPGIYAAGDNSTPMRSVATAVAAGTAAGAMVNHEMVSEAD